MKPTDFQELINFAIAQEQESAQFYTSLAGTVQKGHVRQALLEFAQQERGHEAKLRALAAQGSAAPGAKPVPDLKIADYVIEQRPSADMDYRDALVIAMHKEKAAYRLYQDLARHCEDPELRDVFRFLAQEEASHKLMFETEYDDMTTEN